MEKHVSETKASPLYGICAWYYNLLCNEKRYKTLREMEVREARMISHLNCSHGRARDCMPSGSLHISCDCLEKNVPVNNIGL